MRLFASAIFLFAFSSLRAQVAPPPPLDTSYAEYREDWITLPLGIGLRIPSYDRVNGLSLPWGPVISLADDHVRIFRVGFEVARHDAITKLLKLIS